MICYPNCKVNIGLDILRRRPDGYHDIETVMYPVPWTDILEIVPSKTDKDSLTVSGNSVDCPIEKNLVMKALHALREKCYFPTVDIYLHKIIPDGAGLGGGSSDAAHTITLINNMFDLQLTTHEMAQTVSSIGSDCPFFLYNKPMLATATGTILQDIELSLKGCWIVIAKRTNASVSTAMAYSGVTPFIPEESLANKVKLPINTWQERVINSFEKSVFAICPDIADVKQRMMHCKPIYCAMSGSGSAVFGMFEGQPDTKIIQDLFSDCTTFIGRL